MYIYVFYKYAGLHVFDVGSADPKRLLNRLYPRKHFDIVGSVGDVGEHGMRIVIVFVCLCLHVL